MAKAKKPQRTKHDPQRTCIACHRVSGKREMVRIVRTRDSGIQIDPGGKLAGRGAYICLRKSCWHRALDRSLIKRALKVPPTEGEMALLQGFAGRLSDDTKPIPEVPQQPTTAGEE
ncbi:MAG: YlxR family protein [Chloroflexota bacterium]|nr:YlxR family protein [Chloroflexota bacterium]